MSQFSMMHIKEDTEMKLLLWSKIILWSQFEYQKNPTKMDDFHLLGKQTRVESERHIEYAKCSSLFQALLREN